MCVEFIFKVAHYEPLTFWIITAFAINRCSLIPGDRYILIPIKIKGNVHVLSRIESGILLSPVTSSTPQLSMLL